LAGPGIAFLLGSFDQEKFGPARTIGSEHNSDRSLSGTLLVDPPWLMPLQEASDRIERPVCHDWRC
jgi:hypothetical protein